MVVATWENAHRAEIKQPIYGQIVGLFRDKTVRKTKFTRGAPLLNPDLVSERYKVRIFGRTRPGTKESDLPIAKIRSITSGVGGESFGFEPILAPNTFVEVEIDNGGNIWIVNTIKNVPADLKRTAEKEGVPSSGFLPGRSVPTIKTNPSSTDVTSEVPNQTVPNKEDEKQQSDNETINLLSACKKINVEAVNSDINELIADLKEIKSKYVGEESFIGQSQQEILEIQQRIKKASKSIARWTAWLVQEIRKFVLRQTNSAIGMLIGNAPLSTRYLVQEAKDGSLSVISCLFIRLLSNLENLIFGALSMFVDKIINTATCMVETFMSSFIGQIVGQLASLINAALGKVSNLLGSVIKFGTDIIDFVISILDFLTCKPENICPKTNKWNPLEGGKPETLKLDFKSIFDAAKGVASDYESVVGIPDDITQFAENFNFTFDAGDVLNNLWEGCNQFTGPNPCGPPTVVFWGGSGSGAAGNVVINAIGDIIGVDLTDFGEYEEAPFISFEDNCGNGQGGIAVPVLGTYVPIGTEQPVQGVVDVIIPESGYGYLPYPDGSTGGGGRVYAGRCETIVQRVNGDYEVPYNEGDVIQLYYGDTITLPGQAPVRVDCDFTIAELPGSIETGEKYCPQDMTGRGLGGGIVNPDGSYDPDKIFADDFTLKSMVGFDDTRGSSPELTPPISIAHQTIINQLLETQRAQELVEEERKLVESGVIQDAGRPDQFGFTNDYPYARSEGFSDSDIRFYIEGFYSKLLGKRVGPLMQAKLEDPNFGPIPRTITSVGGIKIFDCENDLNYALQNGFTEQDIRFFLENFWPYELDECMRNLLNDPNWGRIPEYFVSLTAPGCPDQEEVPDTYTVTPTIGDVVIYDQGFGYSPDDEAIVLDCSGNPDSVAKVEVKFDDAGRIIAARVLNPGTSFACIPEIIINTETGYNGRLGAVMNFADEIPYGDVVQVVDCVGNVGDSMRSMVNE